MVTGHTELRPGLHVNIVLKADQRTGRLTSGHVADVLTRGDHPHGVKVRLLDGQVGRVQSLGSRASDAAQAPAAGTNSSTTSTSLSGSHSTSHIETSRKQNNREQPSGSPVPVATASLMDYIKPTKPHTSPIQDASMSAQEQLEKSFPELDSALIAAILVDYPALHDAKNVLLTLCGNRD